MNETKSGLASKINWTQIIAVIATVSALFGVDLSPELQASVVAAIMAVSGLVTIVLRTWFTNTKVDGLV